MAQTKPADPAPKVRSQRWTTPESRPPAAPARASARAALVSRISVNREAEAVCSGRAAASATVAANQIRKASLRLERIQVRSKTQASLATFVGCLGLIGNLYGALAPFDSAATRAIVCVVATLAMAVPLAMTTIRCLSEGQDSEIEAATAVEAATRIAGFSKQIGEAVASASDAVGLSPTALVVLAPLLDAMEREAELSRQREQTMHAAERAAERSYTRIKPTQDKVIVTTGDGRKLTARILDLSMAGVALETDLPGVGIGSVVVVGSRKALAVRKLARGLAFQFETAIAAAAFNVDIVL